MGKGEAWVNGENIGRYWVSLKAPNGQPSQSLYAENNSYVHLFDNYMCTLANVKYQMPLKHRMHYAYNYEPKFKNAQSL